MRYKIKISQTHASRFSLGISARNRQESVWERHYANVRRGRPQTTHYRFDTTHSRAENASDNEYDFFSFSLDFSPASSYPVHHTPSEDLNPFAAYVVVTDDGRMILDDGHIYYKREHYFAAEDVISVVRAFVLRKRHFSPLLQPPNHQVCRWMVPDNSTMAQLWLTNDTLLTDVYFLCREDVEICCEERCCWDAEHASNKQAEVAGKLVMWVLLTLFKKHS